MYKTTQIWLIGLAWLSSSALVSAADEVARIAEVLSRAEQSLAKVEPAGLRQGLRQSVEQAKAFVAMLAAAKRRDGREVAAQLTRRQPGNSEAAETVRRRERERIVQSLLAKNALSEAAVVAFADDADAVLLARVAAAQADSGQSESAAANFLRAAAAFKPGDSARVPRQADDDGRRRDIAFIMRPQIQNGDLQGAARTARAFSSLLLRAMALVMIADAQTGAGDNQSAATTLAEAAKFAKKLDELEPAPDVDQERLRLWAEIGAAQSRAKAPAADSFQRAKKIAADFDRPESRAQGFAEVASFQPRCGLAMQAQQTFVTAIGEANRIRLRVVEDFGDVVDPRPRVLEEVAVRQALAGDVEAALETVVVVGPDQTVAATRRLALLIGETGDAALARRLTAAAIPWKDNPTVRRSLTFVNAATGQTGTAITLADGDPALLSVIVRVRADARDFRGARRALAEFPKGSEAQRHEGLAIVAREQAEAGETDAAVKTVAAAQGGPFDSVLEMIARDYARDGWLQKALQAAGQIENDYRRSFAQQRVAMAAMVRGEFDDALRVAELIEEPRQRRSALERIAQELTTTDSPKAKVVAERALRECDAIEDAQQRDEAKWTFFCGLARAQFRAGDPAAATRTLLRLDMLENVRAEYRASQPQVGSAVWIAQSGNLAAAMSKAEQIKNPAERVIAYLNIAEAMINSNDAD